MTGDAVEKENIGEGGRNDRRRGREGKFRGRRRGMTVDAVEKENEGGGGEEKQENKKI